MPGPIGEATGLCIHFPKHGREPVLQGPSWGFAPPPQLEQPLLHVCFSPVPQNLLPQLQDANGVSRRKKPPDKVEVSHEDAAVRPGGQRNGRKELAAVGWPIAVGAGDSPLVSIAHNCGDDWGLLGEEYVFSVPFMYDAWLNTHGWTGRRTVSAHPSRQNNTQSCFHAMSVTQAGARYSTVPF